MTLITDTEELAAFCERQRGAPYVTLDTEFLREQTYYPKLCLLQIAGPEEAVAVDSLAPGLELTPLLPLFDDEETVKVFHAGRQDLEIFLNLFDRLPRPLFDTQLAAAVCGFGEQVAYDTLVKRITGIGLDKASRFTDWSRRPLSERQLAYALADVVHLRPVYLALKEQLEESGRLPWIADDLAEMNDPGLYRVDPQQAWRRLKTRSNDPKFLGRLKALAAWREEEARRRDIPRNRMIRDEQLQEIAAHAPEDSEALARTRGISNDMARGKLGQGLLAALAQAAPLSRDERPDRNERRDSNGVQGSLIELLKVLQKLRAEEHGVAPRLIASAQEIEALASGDGDLPLLSGWRYEIFGKDALALREGRLALTCRNGAIRTIESEAG